MLIYCGCGDFEGTVWTNSNLFCGPGYVNHENQHGWKVEFCARVQAMSYLEMQDAMQSNQEKERKQKHQSSDKNIALAASFEATSHP
ncbi:hypothetical protein C5167_044000 [Papaver somniferum]|uniref:Uncharacterized protein n=1 Tax=Papaver somniferum TaxID=3469 RepID=A0A4Y7L9S2_PAPSO|nr:hypothetical protein C5167_044000 [Papaver somniferum]